MFRRVIYISNTQSHMSDDDVLRLYGVASVNAARDGLTGLTAYYQNSMFHIREGDSQLVSNSIVRAESQGWHYNLSIVQDAMFDTRLFDSWYLAYAPESLASLTKGKCLLNLDGIKSLPLMQTALKDLMFTSFFDIFASDFVEDEPIQPAVPLQVQTTQEFIESISANAMPQ